MKKLALAILVSLLLPASAAFACGVTCFSWNSCTSGNKAICQTIDGGCFAWGRCMGGGGGMACKGQPDGTWIMAAAHVTPPAGEAPFQLAITNVRPAEVRPVEARSVIVARAEK